MPFDRTKLGTFRTILRQLTDDYGLSSEKLLNEIAGDRKAKSLSQLHVSRALLDRVKGGHDTRKINDLGEIWDYLAVHPRYHVVFEKSDTTPTTLAPAAALAEAFRGFFPENREGNTYHLRDIRSQFVGRYTMYRPAWRVTLKDAALIQTSAVEIVDTAYGLQITETQDFPIDSPYYYYQKDEGVLFPYGKYIYYMTKELGGGRNQSAVKLGVIEGFVTAGGLAQRFQGVVFGSSNLFIYPAAKLYCRRTTALIKSEVILAENVPDREARQYLASPILSTPLLY